MKVSLVVLAAFLAASLASAAGLVGNADRGERIYEVCTDCHSLDKNDVGPRHRGVFDRKAGSLPDYSYSDALKSSNIVWNEETLDKWLTDPQAFVPGVKMYFHLESAQDRADVIAYLKERAKWDAAGRRFRRATGAAAILAPASGGETPRPVGPRCNRGE